MSKRKARTIVLPDSRLRLERRPKWLDLPIPPRVRETLRQQPRNGAQFLRLIGNLLEEVEGLTSADDHPIDPINYHLGIKHCRVCQRTMATAKAAWKLLGDLHAWSPEDPSVCTACVKPKGGAA